MSEIVFATISPHPPLLLPSVGSAEDKKAVKNTITSLENLGKELKKADPDIIIISSPHKDWGFGAPLHFLARDFRGKIEKILINLQSPQYYFEQGMKFLVNHSAIKPSSHSDLKIALIASGDLSHVLREDGPYGFHSDGPKFDKTLIESLKNKDINTILKLDELYPEAGECGLRSFCFMLGILDSAKLDWKPEILSYEAPFGVGYLVANLKFKM